MSSNSFIEHLKKIKEEAETRWRRRKSIYDSLISERTMKRYRKIVKIENPNLRSGDKKFKAAVLAMKTYFLAHKQSDQS